MNTLKSLAQTTGPLLLLFKVQHYSTRFHILSQFLKKRFDCILRYQALVLEYLDLM